MNQIILLFLILLQLEILAAAGVYAARRGQKTRFTNPTFVDTSVLMDGRIMAAAQAGFLPGTVVIPRSVIAELQLLADSSDGDKRQRARHGLDVVSLLQELERLDVRILADGKAPTGVDDQLLALAKKYDGTICTIDFNLNKVAVVENIPVLNINELAQQLRMDHLPGEKVSLMIQQKGNGPNQGVGYLADGTMVVVDQAGGNLNQQVEIEFVRSLQTVAGRMVFAKKVSKASSGNASPKKSAGKPAASADSPKPKRRTDFKHREKPEDKLISLVNEQSGEN